MINIHRFVDELPRKQRFYDKSKFLSYELARLSASKFLEDPSLLERGREFMERHMRPDPCQASQRGTTTFRRNCARVALSEARSPQTLKIHIAMLWLHNRMVFLDPIKREVRLQVKGVRKSR